MNNRESRCSFRVGVFCYRTNVAMSLQYIGNVMNTSFATLERITNNSCLLTQWILTKKLNFLPLKSCCVIFLPHTATTKVFSNIYNVYLNNTVAKLKIYAAVSWYSFSHLAQKWALFSILINLRNFCSGCVIAVRA